jgi:hypothetical protein
MATETPERTEEVAAKLLEVVQSRPGITVTDLAKELCLIDQSGTVLATLREALDLAVDRGEAIAVTVEEPDEPAELHEAWGPDPSDEEIAAARIVGVRAETDALADALDGALTREQAATRLGVSSQAVSERRKTGKLTALERGREWRFPAWQFYEAGTLPGLSELIAAWPGSSLSLSRWATTASADLDGRAPAQELRRRGGPERVLASVEAISAAAW